MLKLTWARAAAWRAHRHHLHQRAPAGSTLAIASRLCGLHAQVLSAAELCVWARVEGLRPGDVRRALWEERTLVKTWAMRGTLHLLPAAELPMWYGALGGSRRYRRPAVWKRLLGISLDELDRLTEAIGTALKDRVMTREELVHEVGRITGSRALAKKLAVNSWGTFLKPAAFTGRLCFAPGVGQLVRFTRPDTWIPASRPHVDQQAASLAITRRFLAAYGPATPHDFARWWGGGGGVTGARKSIAALGEEAAPVEVDGCPAWMLAADARDVREHRPGRNVSLLPAFDQYVIGASRHTECLLPGDFRSRIYRPQGWVSQVLLVNGRMDGVWRHELRGSRVDISIEPFVNLPSWARRVAASEAERLAAFFGRKLNLAWSN